MMLGMLEYERSPKIGIESSPSIPRDPGNENCGGNTVLSRLVVLSKA